MASGETVETVTEKSWKILGKRNCRVCGNPVDGLFNMNSSISDFCEFSSWHACTA